MRRLLVLGVLLAPSVASAQTSSMNGATVVIEPRVSDGSGNWTLIGPTDNNYQLERQFNLARCLCSQAGDTNVTKDKATDFAAHIYYGTQPTSAVTDTNIQIWTGPDCDTADPANRPATCGTVPKYTITGDQIQQGLYEKMKVKDVMDPTNTGQCPGTQGKENIYVLTDPDNNSVFDDKFSTSVDVDSKIPAAPTSFTTASGGEGRIVLGWKGLGSSAFVL